MDRTLRKSQNSISAILLVAIVGIIYSNTLDCGWYLDDYQNITKNYGIHMTRIDIDSLKNALYAAPSKEGIDRPLSYFTFALNWYWGQDDVKGYHIVNIGIHILASIFLFLAIILLFQSPNIRESDSNNIYFVALLSSVLWAIHPIQIQAVTYIVQRMTSMAALFYIVGLFCFLKARLTSSIKTRLYFSSLTGLAYLLGIASKNNAILLPVSLLIAEFVFFRDLSQRRTQKQALVTLGIGAILVAVVGIFIFIGGNVFAIFEGYDSRPFTIYQRFLTQSRVLIFYLSQIFYPVADRFSIAHDFTISTSILTPWTTLFSIIFILFLIGLSFCRIKKNPFLSFAILFYFGNQVIESTIIPLEMVFEHRNYLPTMFLFLPVSVCIKKALDYYGSSRKPMFYFLVFSICAILIGVGTSTYIRNLDWRSSKSLWEDAVKKAPELGRPLHNLAWGYFERNGLTDNAVELYLKAADSKFERKEYNADPYNNLASVYYKKNDFEKAYEYASKAIEIYPDHNKANLLLCYALGKLGRYDQSLSHLDEMLLKYPDNVDFAYLKGLILMKISQPENALECFRNCLKRVPDDWNFLREAGYCLTRMKLYGNGYRLLKRAEEKNKKQIGILMGLAENRIMAGYLDKGAEYVNKIVEIVGVENIEKSLINNSTDKLGLPVFYRLVVPPISRNMVERSEKCSQSAIQLMKYFNSD